MSTIRRAIVLNDVEPCPLSFRAPMGIETWIDLDIYDQGNPPSLHHTGLGGQMMLTGRSTQQTTSYTMVAVDVANGKTRTVIPAGDIQDPYGYQLRVFGTVNSQLALIATGTVMPIAAVTPDVIAPDVIDNIPMQLQRKVDADMQVDIWVDAGKTVPYDLSTTTLTASVYADSSESLPLAPFTVTSIDNNSVLLHMPAATVTGLPDACWWSLRAFYGAGTTTLAQGDVTVIGIVTPPPPPLVTLTANFDYQIPNTGTPASGQIMQQSYVRDKLLISTTDNGGNDVTATLAALRPGHFIRTGTGTITTWTVQNSVGAQGYYIVTVTPITQVTAGVAAFTFSAT